MQPSQNTRSSRTRYQRLDVADPDQADMDPSSLEDRITTEQDDSSASAQQKRGGLNFSQRQPRSTNRSNVFGGRMNREGDLEEEVGMDEEDEEDENENAGMGTSAGAGRRTGDYDFASEDFDDL